MKMAYIFPFGTTFHPQKLILTSLEQCLFEKSFLCPFPLSQCLINIHIHFLKREKYTNTIYRLYCAVKNITPICVYVVGHNAIQKIYVPTTNNLQDLSFEVPFLVARICTPKQYSLRKLYKPVMVFSCKRVRLKK